MANVPYFNGTGSVYGCIRKIDGIKPGAPGFIIPLITDIQMYTELVPLNMEHSAQNVCRYSDIFYNVVKNLV